MRCATYSLLAAPLVRRAAADTGETDSTRSLRKGMIDGANVTAGVGNDNPHLLKDILALKGNSGGPDPIVGGEPMNPGERPYLVSLGDYYGPGNIYYFHSCGATLILPNVVLTAAHCFGASGDLSETIINTVNLNKFEIDNNDGVITYPICFNEYGIDCNLDTHAYFVVHPEYDDSSLNNDFALIFLPEEVLVIDPVALNADPEIPVEDDELVTFGWGTLTSGGISPNVPHIVTVFYETNEQCDEDYSELYGPGSITPEMLCAADIGEDSCQGDSGGPIVWDFHDGSSVQVGITSWGEGCADPGYPGVYARVSSGLQWIRDTICGQNGEWCNPITPSPTQSPTTTGSPTQSMAPTQAPIPTPSPTGEDGGHCFELRDENDSISISNLPGFIQLMIERGILQDKNSAANSGKAKEKESRRKLTNSTSTKRESDGFPGLPEGIVGGDEAKEGALPFLVSFGMHSLASTTPDGHACAGSLIKPDVILSAASCFTDTSGNKITMDYVDLKKYDLSLETPGSVRVNLQRSDVWRHKDFNHTTLENDIALVFLPFTFNDDVVETVMLNENATIPGGPGDLLDVSGWGDTFLNGPFSNVPRTATLGYLSNEGCSEEVTPDRMCAVSATQEIRGPCTGDTGGPLTVQTPNGPTQVGVASVGVCVPRGKGPPLPKPPCPSDMQELTISILLDYFPDETFWDLTNLCTGEVQESVEAGEYKFGQRCTEVSLSYCVSPDVQYGFTIRDSYGDGQSSPGGAECEVGSYSVSLDGEELFSGGGDWGYSESNTIGSYCEEPPVSVFSRVSSGMEWIDRAIECRTQTPVVRSSKSGKTSKSVKTSKSGKSRKIDMDI